MTEHETGRYCHELARELFPISRSLSGPGVRETLEILRRDQVTPKRNAFHGRILACTGRYAIGSNVDPS